MRLKNLFNKIKYIFIGGIIVLSMYALGAQADTSGVNLFRFNRDSKTGYLVNQVLSLVFGSNATSTSDSILEVPGKITVREIHATSTATLFDLNATTTNIDTLNVYTEARHSLLHASTTDFDSLFATEANISILHASTTDIDTLTVYDVEVISTLNATTTNIDYLTVFENARIKDLNATTTQIGTLHIYTDFTTDDTGLVSNFNSEFLNSQNGAYYRNWDNFTNKPATSTILSLLDSDYRISVLNATTTNIGALQVYTSADFNDINITSVGDIALDSLTSDGSTITIGGTPSMVFTDGTSIAMTLGNDAGDDFTIDTSAFVVEGDTGNVGIGDASPDFLLEVEKTQNAGTILGITNSQNGTAGIAGEQFFTDAGTGSLLAFSSGYNTSNQYIADSFLLESASSMSQGLGLSAGGAQPIKMWINGGNRWELESDGDVLQSRSNNGNQIYTLENTSSGTASAAIFKAQADAGSMSFFALSSGYTTSNQYIADSGLLETSALSGGLGISSIQGPIKFWTGSDEKMIIDTNGNVGIGTTLPGTIASWDGSATGIKMLNILDSSNSARIVIQGGGTNGAVMDWVDLDGGVGDKWMSLEMDDGVLKYKSINDTGTAVVSDNILVMDLGNGNVGIGTVSPGVKLEVAGDMTVSGGDLVIGTSGVSHAIINAPESFFFNVDSDNSQSGSTIKFAANRSGTAGGTELMVIQDTGNVGIGTASINEMGPYSSTLQIAGSAANQAFGGSLRLASNDGTTYSAGIRQVQGKLFFNTGFSDTDTMIIDASGNVGIGTASPDTKLQVVGTTKFGDDNTNYMTTASDGDLTFVGTSGLQFGSFYGNEIAWTQASAVQNTWYDISDADLTTGNLNDITHNGSGQLTVPTAGIYSADFAGSFEASATGVHVQVTFSINGTETVNGINHFETSGASRQHPLSGTAILNLSANDTVNVSIRTTDAGTPDLLIDHLSLKLIQIGGN